MKVSISRDSSRKCSPRSFTLSIFHNFKLGNLIINSFNIFTIHFINSIFPLQHIRRKSRNSCVKIVLYDHQPVIDIPVVCSQSNQTWHSILLIIPYRTYKNTRIWIKNKMGKSCPTKTVGCGICTFKVT